MKVSMFTKEEKHDDQAEFHLLVLISKYARDPWRRSLTSQTDHWGKSVANEARFHHQSVHNKIKMPRECAAVGCAELQTKGSLFSFHTFPKGSSRRKLHPWRLELEIVPSRLPCGHPHRHEFFTKGYRSRIARHSLGWSLVDGRNSLFGWNLHPCQFYKEYIQTDQRTQKYILTPWHPAQIKIKKGKHFFHKKPFRKRKGNQQKRQMYTQILSKNELVINAEEEEGRERGRKRKKKKRRKKKKIDMVNTDKRKEKQNYPTQRKNVRFVKHRDYPPHSYIVNERYNWTTN